MANEGKPQPFDVNNIVIPVSEDLKSGVYSNTMNLVATNTEITINFAYVNPTDNPPATLVSRVIIPPEFAKNIVDSLNQVIEAQEKSKK